MNIERLKGQIARKNKLNLFPKTIAFNLLNNSEFKSKPVRTMSGVAPVAIMTKPEHCPHGTCTFCSGGPGSYFGDVPKSYTGNEPASMRALRNTFDAYLQVFNRLEHYVLLQQVPEKVELIIMGGTFLAYDRAYQDSFIMDALQAMNDFGELFFDENGLKYDFFKGFFELPRDFKNKDISDTLKNKILLLKKKSTLEQEQLKNETSKIRCCVFNLETKPDWCFEEHINQALRLGTTRVEVGIQTLNDSILKKTNRGHTLEDSKKASQLLKDSFLKTCFHVMIGLPGSSKKEDINNFKILFEDENYKPDALKIYPCMVMPGTPLFKQYEKGMFKPLNTEEASEILIEAKKFIPEYCRVMRIVRDIPTKHTVDGVGMNNLRQYLHEKMIKENVKCRCIRCREPRNKNVDWDNVELKRIDYESSGGKELFLSFEDGNYLLGFLRLRKPYKPFRKEITKDSVGVREMHVYGEAASLGKKGKIQHRGLGKKLLLEAERIAKEEFKAKKMLIISGIGTKEYFYNLGYKKEGVYVSKALE